MLTEIGIDGQKFIVIFFRVAAMLWLLPVFSLKTVAVPFKMTLSLVIAFFILESIPIRFELIADPYLLVITIMREVFIGLVISFFVRTLFTAVYMAGEIIAMQTGFAFARVMDPITMTQASIMEQLGNLLTIMVFFAMDAHHILIRGIFYSFKVIPVGGATVNKDLISIMVDFSGRIYGIGFRIGAPVIVAILVTEIALGLLARMVPQVNVFIEGMPIKILLAITILSFSMGILVPSIIQIFRGMDGEMARMFKLMV